MAGAGHWQLVFEKVEHRVAHLFYSGKLTDCTFMVGSGTNPMQMQAHKLVLSIASPVFEAMFLSQLHKDQVVSITDIQPEVFRRLLQYIYTGYIDEDNTGNIDPFDLACDLWYVANKYMLPHLERQCIEYICSAVDPRNVCRAYELARLFEEKTVIDKCIQIISTNTKEVLNDSSLMDVQLKTLITVCSLEHLTVDSELDLFHAVARYAEAEQRRQGQISPPVEGEPPSKKLRKSLQHSSACAEKELLQSFASTSKTSPAAELNSRPPTEVVTSEPLADKQHLKEEEPSIRAALQKLRFLSLTAAQFAEGPARSGLLTEGESFAVLMNIASRNISVPMPTGFSECRDRRQPQNAQCFEAGSLDHTINALQPGDPSQVENAQCFEAGSLDHTINALQPGDPSQVENAQYFEAGSLDHTINALQSGDPSQVEAGARAASDILYGYSTSPYIQSVLDKGILDALVPALTEGSVSSKKHAASAICWFCTRASPAQLRVLAEGAALQPFCRLLADGGFTYNHVLYGLTSLVQKVELTTYRALLHKLITLGVPQLLSTVHRQYFDQVEWDRAGYLLRICFNEDPQRQN